MSSFFDEASLVMIPSGYKDQKVYSIKPLDGSGDLTFSRASNATRVASNGLIEKVRTNLLTYSQSFTNAAWTKSNVSATGGQTDPNGNTTASLVQTTTASSAYFYQAQTGAKCFSIYAKAGTRTSFSIINGLFNNGAGFNLSTQTASVAGAGSLAKIESVGGGWFRCSVFLSSSTDMIISLSDVSGGGMSVGDNLYFAFAQAETGDIATDYIATTSAAVSVGPVSGLPRLDYLNSSCPRLLLEPQRTNNLTYSEQFNNAAWATDGNGAGETKTANYAISPDGYQDADRIQLNRTGGSYSRVRQDYVAAGAHTGSVYLKSNTGASQKVWMRVDGGTATKITITTSWQRFIVSGSTSAALELFIDNTDAEIATIADFSAWGAQLEAGAYATSYIPTLSTSVTRVADVTSKTGISSLIGQTEGTMFAEFTYNGVANSGVYEIIMELAADANNVISLNKNNTTAELYVFANVGGVIQVNSVGISGTNILGTHKVALAYKLNDYVCYLDGVQVFSDTSATVPTCSRVSLGTWVGDTQQLGGTINQSLLFKTRLSNSDLAALTA